MSSLRTAIEIGAGDYRTCYCIKKPFHEIVLYEPNHLLAEDIRKKAKLSGVSLVEKAVFNKNGKHKFYNFGFGGYLQGVPSFMNLSFPDPIEEALEPISTMVETIDVACINVGGFDFLNLTCCGSELAIIERAKELPRVVRTVQYIQSQEQGVYSQQVWTSLQNRGYQILSHQPGRLNTYFETIFKKHD